MKPLIHKIVKQGAQNDKLSNKLLNNFNTSSIIIDGIKAVLLFFLNEKRLGPISR